jgi:hypothetical protein
LVSRRLRSILGLFRCGQVLDVPPVASASVRMVLVRYHAGTEAADTYTQVMDELHDVCWALPLTTIQGNLSHTPAR